MLQHSHEAAPGPGAPVARPLSVWTALLCASLVSALLHASLLCTVLVRSAQLSSYLCQATLARAVLLHSALVSHLWCFRSAGGSQSSVFHENGKCQRGAGLYRLDGESLSSISRNSVLRAGSDGWNTVQAGSSVQASLKSAVFKRGLV